MPSLDEINDHIRNVEWLLRGIQEELPDTTDPKKRSELIDCQREYSELVERLKQRRAELEAETKRLH